MHSGNLVLKVDFGLGLMKHIVLTPFKFLLFHIFLDVAGDLNRAYFVGGVASSG